MKRKALWVLLLSLIVSVCAFAQSDSDDESDDKCEQCQICFGTEDLRQVCECVHNVCRSCLQRLVTDSAGKTQISCPNCRRKWEISELINRCELQRTVPERRTVAVRSHSPVRFGGGFEVPVTYWQLLQRGAPRPPPKGTRTIFDTLRRPNDTNAASASQ